MYLGETENVVNEKKHILTFLISEVFSNSQTGKGDTGTSSWGFVHLTVDEGDLGVTTSDVDDTTFNHFVVQIVTFHSFTQENLIYK